MVCVCVCMCRGSGARRGKPGVQQAVGDLVRLGKLKSRDNAGI